VTIAISTKVGEGLVYAADSTSSYLETLQTTSGPESRLVQSFHHARKLMQLGGYPIGILTYGLGTIEARNLESLVAEFEHDHLKPYDLLGGEEYSVEDLANRLHHFIKEKYDAAFPAPAPAAPGDPMPPDQRPRMGVIVGGFSHDEFYPDEWQFLLPDGPPSRVRDNQAGDWGVRWWGVTDPVMRLIAGVDPRIEKWLVDQGIDPTQASGIYFDLISKFRWTIFFDGMPVQDAIDLAVFLANVTIGHSRFVVGPPVCGGHVDVATITHKGFAWVRQKKTAVKGDSVFF
jgi:hypothetical protein